MPVTQKQRMAKAKAQAQAQAQIRAQAPRTTKNSNKPQSPPVPSVPSPALSSESSRSTPPPSGSAPGSPSPGPSVLDNSSRSASTYHRRSISDLDVADMDAFGRTMGDISAAISSARISRPAIAKLEELRELEDLVEKYQKAADWVKNQDHDKFTTVKAVPLSKTTIPLLESIGTEFPARQKLVTNDSMVTQEWLKSENILSKKDLVKLKQWDKTNLTSTLEWLDDTVSDNLEASARMVIDQWAIELGRFCQELGLIIRIYPEMAISLASKAPAVITHGDVCVRLTGLTDYLMWKVTKTQHKELEATNMYEEYQHIQKEMMRFDESGARLMFLEAKNVRQKLESHLAQVVAQNIAAICITRDDHVTSKLKISEMPFVLTNGNEWMFGLVSSTPEKTKCWYTAELEFSEKEEILLMLLYIWATKSTAELSSILKSQE